MSHTSIGARRRRFVLELPLEAPDGFGGVVRTYAAGPQLWGAIETVRGEERFRAGRTPAELRAAPLPHRVRVRSGRGAARARVPRRGGRAMTSPILALRAAILAATQG